MAAQTSALEPGSVLARTLYEVFDGAPVIVVSSPPGAGKSTLIAQVVKVLLERTDLSVCVAAFTNASVTNIAVRIADELDAPGGPDRVVRLGSGYQHHPGVANRPSGDADVNQVVVRTLSSLVADSAAAYDLLIVDEAYQATFSLAADAAGNTPQILMVGDPGQIGPVVSNDPSPWERMNGGPHRRAPEVFGTMDGAVHLNLDTSYRLGAETVDLIGPLYDFDFTSGRPERWVENDQGWRLPEILEHVLDPVTSVADHHHVARVVELARSYIGRTLHLSGPDGPHVETVTDADIAIVVSRRVQRDAATAMVSAAGLDITVGTADTLQGGQWHVVVAVDPLVGESVAGSHQLTTGRLCVMLSRHMTHLVWVHDNQWRGRLEVLAGSPREVELGKVLRQRLCAEPDA